MDPYFLLALISILGGVLVVAMKVCFASKCEQFQICWGFLSVKRNVIVEDREFHDEAKVDRGSSV